MSASGLCFKPAWLTCICIYSACQLSGKGSLSQETEDMGKAEESWIFHHCGVFSCRLFFGQCWQHNSLVTWAGQYAPHHSPFRVTSAFDSQVECEGRRCPGSSDPNWAPSSHDRSLLVVLAMVWHHNSVSVVNRKQWQFHGRIVESFFKIIQETENTHIYSPTSSHWLALWRPNDGQRQGYRSFFPFSEIGANNWPAPLQAFVEMRNFLLFVRRGRSKCQTGFTTKAFVLSFWSCLKVSLLKKRIFNRLTNARVLCSAFA